MELATLVDTALNEALRKRIPDDVQQLQASVLLLLNVAAIYCDAPRRMSAQEVYDLIGKVAGGGPANLFADILEIVKKENAEASRDASMTRPAETLS